MTTIADAWDPGVYDTFKVQRSKPFFDLLDLVEGPTARVVDLGCGTGELTAAAVDRLHAVRAVGIDNSPAMLHDAAAHAVDGRLSFTAGDIGDWTSDHDTDLVLANASLHWIADHPATLARWTAALAPGGQIAVQVPTNATYPTHTVAVEIAHTEPFLAAFGAAGPPPDPVAENVLTPQQYAELLFALGFEDQVVRLQIYAHVLPETSGVIDWVSGTMLTRFKAVLPADLYALFVERYTLRLMEVLGDHRPFLFPFARVLFWGRLPR